MRITSKNLVRVYLQCLIVGLIVAVHNLGEVGSVPSRGQKQPVHNNYQVNEKIVKHKTNKVNNINMKEKNKYNSQVAQVVVNVPKQNLVLRSNRYPTKEEFELRERIVEIYKQIEEEVPQVTKDNSPSYNHLGAIVRSLNPKYIATVRIFRAVNSDPNHPHESPFPFSRPEEGGHCNRLELKVSQENADTGLDGSNLDQLLNHLLSTTTWDSTFVQALVNTTDRRLTSRQLTVKRLVLCISDERLCQKAAPVLLEANAKLQSKGVYGMMSGKPEGLDEEIENYRKDVHGDVGAGGDVGGDTEDEEEEEEEEEEDEEEEEEDYDEEEDTDNQEKSTIAPTIEKQVAPKPAPTEARPQVKKAPSFEAKQPEPEPTPAIQAPTLESNQQRFNRLRQKKGGRRLGCPPTGCFRHM